MPHFERPLATFAVATLLLAGCTGTPLVREHPIAPEDEPRFVAPKATAKWALVLSSGAMRGFAHIGVIRELRAAGLEPELIVATSVGSLVGALATSGLEGEQLADAAQALNVSIFADLRAPRFGIPPRGRLHEFLPPHSLHRPTPQV